MAGCQRLDAPGSGTFGPVEDSAGAMSMDTAGPPAHGARVAKEHAVYPTRRIPHDAVRPPVSWGTVAVAGVLAADPLTANALTTKETPCTRPD